MSLDPSIPLQAKGISLESPIDQASKAMSLKAMMGQGQLQDMQIQKMQTDVQQQKDLHENLKGADLSSDEGKTKALSEVMRVNPEVGMKLSEQFGKQKLQEAQIKEHIAKAGEGELKVFKEKTDMFNDATASILTPYNEYIKKGLPKQVAAQLVEPLYQKTLATLSSQKGSDGKPLIDVSQAPTAFDPDFVQGHAMQSKKMLDYLKQEEDKRHHRATESIAYGNLDVAIKKEAREAENTGGAVGDFTKIGEDFLNSLPVSQRKIVKDIADGKIDPKSLSIKGGHRERLLSQVAQYNPDYNQQDYGAADKAVKSFATGKQGDSVRSFNVALEHLDLLKDLTIALKNGDVKLINQIGNKWAEQTGGTAITNFSAAKDIIGQEVVKAIVANGGGQAEREEAAKKIASSKSPDQLFGVADTYTKLFGGQLKGLEKQYTANTNRKDFRERLLTDKARKVVSNLADENISPTGVGYSDPDKERRYQEWKKQHAQ